MAAEPPKLQNNLRMLIGDCFSFREAVFNFLKGYLWEADHMNASYINPFLSSSITVIETLIQVKPSIGQLSVKPIADLEGYVWLKIGIVGQFKGDIIFCFPDQVAKDIVSAMMGGYPVTEMDEMCISAISELGNMISGNASTIMFNDGIRVDITPPNILNNSQLPSQTNTISVPLQISNIGEFDIHMIA
jgi:chemotaxis protein CheX